METPQHPSYENPRTMYQLLKNSLKERGLMIYDNKFDLLGEEEPYYALVIDQATHQRLIEELNDRQLQYYEQGLKRGLTGALLPITRLGFNDLLNHPLTQQGETPEEALLRAADVWDASADDSAADTFDA